MITCNHSSTKLILFLMVINGVVRCFFEQSGTFRDAFRSLGYQSYDYDISDSFGTTDFVVDLFEQIDLAYSGCPSLFDSISRDDLIFAFFPCVHFCGISQTWFSLNHRDYKNWSFHRIGDYMIEKNRLRSHFYELLLKLVFVCLDKGFRIIIENPYSFQTFLRVFLKPPDLVDYNRMLRGDYMVKPTAFWFFNCIPVYGLTSFQFDKSRVSPMKLPSGVPGSCSIPRSLISSDYVLNFINDFILGSSKNFTQLSLFP